MSGFGVLLKELCNFASLHPFQCKSGHLMKYNVQKHKTFSNNQQSTNSQLYNKLLSLNKNIMLPFFFIKQSTNLQLYGLDVSYNF